MITKATNVRKTWKQTNQPLSNGAIYRKFKKTIDEISKIEDPILRMIVASEARDDAWLNIEILSNWEYMDIDLALAEIIETSAEEARRQIWEEF